jgi:hypothetical protein
MGLLVYLQPYILLSGIFLSMTTSSVMVLFRIYSRGLVPVCSIPMLEIGTDKRYFMLVNQYNHHQTYLTDVQVAAEYHRADLCRLLTQHGLRPDLQYGHVSPFATCLLFGKDPCPRSDEIETVRLLLQSCDQVDQFDEDKFLFYSLPCLVRNPCEKIQWIWFNAAVHIDDHELHNLRLLLLRTIFAQCAATSCRGFEIGHYTETIFRLMVDARMSEYYLGGNYGFLDIVFGWDLSSLNSQILGAFYLNLLERLNMDVGGCMVRQLDVLTGGVLKSHSWAGERKVVFEPLDHGGWLLRWIWVLDGSAPGHCLVSEHIGLGPDINGAKDWPFFEHPLGSWSQESIDRWAKVEARSTRRLANKARKERARTGQKQPRSRMPGAWNW